MPTSLILNWVSQIIRYVSPATDSPHASRQIQHQAGGGAGSSLYRSEHEALSLECFQEHMYLTWDHTCRLQDLTVQRATDFDAFHEPRTAKQMIGVTLLTLKHQNTSQPCGCCRKTWQSFQWNLDYTSAFTKDQQHDLCSQRPNCVLSYWDLLIT
jgi:hypothetical protein